MQTFNQIYQMVLEKKLILLFLLFLVTAAILDSSTWPNFTILRPWSQVMLHVKFENHGTSGFREEVVWSCLNRSFFDIGIWAKLHT